MALPDLKKEEAITSVLTNNILPLFSRTLNKQTEFYDKLCKEKQNPEFVINFNNFLGKSMGLNA